MADKLKKMRKLSPKQLAFAREYLVDMNATQAAIRAGYSKRSAGQLGDALLKKHEIRRAVMDLQAVRAERVDVDQDWVLSRLVGLFNKCVEAEPFLDKHGKEVGFKAYPSSAVKALELLGKHLGMFPNKVEVSGKDGGPIFTHEVITRMIGFDERLRSRTETLALHAGPPRASINGG